MALPRLLDRSPDRASAPDLARRWRWVGLAGSTLIGVAALGVGSLPWTDDLGNWPRIWPDGRPWPALLLAYLGLTLLAGAWWNLDPATRELPDRLRFLLRTGALWAVPLFLAPPLYSRDVYSYLAQGALYAHGLDPYQVGPSALGGPLAANVSPMWQDTAAPYGPVFLAVPSLVTVVAGGSIVLAVLLLRVVMVGALAATAACLVPLARRAGVDPARAIWLGVLNPLVLAHVVSGAHNDALMVMLMVVGLWLGLGGRPVLAAVVLGLAVLVKLPAAAAVVVLVPAMARTLHGRFRMLRGAALIGSISAVTMLAVTVLMGSWYGWVAALSDTARVRNGLSMSTNLGMLVEGVARLCGLDSVQAVPIARALGVLAAGGLSLLVLARRRGRPLYALGMIMFAVVLLGPVVHPWYLLWGVVPLAAAVRDRRVIRGVALLCIGLALYPMPWGEGFSIDLVWGVAGMAVGVLALGAVVMDRHPVSPDPDDAARAGALTPRVR